jgi:hypothetical protein
MSNNLSKGPIQIFDNSVASINLAFIELLNRLDDLFGLRGRVMISDRIRADDPTVDQDVVTLGTLNEMMEGLEGLTSPYAWLGRQSVGLDALQADEVLALLVPFMAVLRGAQDTLPFASSAETSTGTEPWLLVTPDGLSQSIFGTFVVGLPLGMPGDAIGTGDGKAYFPVPSEMHGMNLVGVQGSVATVSSSGAPTYQVRRLRAGASVDMLSTALTIDANENDSTTAATPAVINTSNDDVTTADQIYIDKDGAGTGELGDFITLKFRVP